MIKEYLIKRALDKAIPTAIGAIKRVLTETGSEFVSTQKDIETSLEHHLKLVETWSSEISFSDLRESKYIMNAFIELDLFVYPRRMRFQAEEQIQRIPIQNILSHKNKHIILLGHPGAGKTTSMKYLCRSLFLDEGLSLDEYSFPLLIRLKDLNGTRPKGDTALILDEIIKILGLSLSFQEKLKKPESADAIKDIKEKIVASALENLSVLLILDGLDELSKIKLREQVIEEVKRLSLQLSKAKLIITSRTGDFVYHIENSTQYEICSLTEEQISQFAIKWLPTEEAANEFLKAVYKSPFADTAIRPLTLAHLCAIYERLGKIPDKPKTVYRKIVNLLLEEWDEQRLVKRLSSYGNFETDRKFEFICNLAYELTVSLRRSSFQHSNLLKAFKRFHSNFDLPLEEAANVIAEIESHTGLVIQSGYEDFEFAHKSLQEFLSAEHIVRLPSIPSERAIILRIPNELAIAVAISSNPSEYFNELVLNRLAEYKITEEFIKAFVGRLMLERPDFNSSPRVGLSLVTLYSLYVKNNVVDDKQLRLFYFDNLISEFEKLVSLVLQRNSMINIWDFYVKDYEYTTVDDNNILRLIKRDDASSRREAELPKFIYTRASFFDEVFTQLRAKDAYLAQARGSRAE